MVEQRGGEPVWAFPPQHTATFARSGLRHAHHPAPRMRQSPLAARAPVNSFPDILLTLGFHDPQEVVRLVRAWMEIFDAIQPQSVVLDFAPAAQLAAHLVGVRAYQLTNGFDAPREPCPPFGLRGNTPEQQRVHAARLGLLSSVLQTVGQDCAGRRDVCAASFFAWPEKAFDTIPELDIHGPRASRFWLGPLGEAQQVTEVPWPHAESGGKRVFAYVRNAPGITDLFDELAEARVNTLCVWPDVSDAHLLRYANTDIRITRNPVPLDSVVPQADAVVSNGSANVICKSLLAGKPLLLLPMDREKHLAARAVVAMGAGVIWGAGSSGAGALRNFLESAALQDGVRRLATRYRGHDFERTKKAFAAALVCGHESPAPAAAYPKAGLTTSSRRHIERQT
jgi:hypothetical protein